MLTSPAQYERNIENIVAGEFLAGALAFAIQFIANIRVQVLTAFLIHFISGTRQVRRGQLGKKRVT
jgi:hypothetical protein